jgi:DNA-binding NarL/FixJ family response regulator
MPPSILIIDPDYEAARVTQAGIQRLLPDSSITIATAADSGWATACTMSPDVVIIDPAPYSLSGLRLIQRLREQAPALRIVVLASAPTPALRQQVRDLNVAAYMEKPLTLPQLIEHLNQVLRSIAAVPIPLAQPVERSISHDVVGLGG